MTKLIAAAMLLAAGFTANATGTPAEDRVTIAVENQKAVVMQLNDLEEGTTISLKDENGRVLFTDQAEAGDYGKVFNLKALGEGELTLEIESASRLEILPIEMTASAATIMASDEMVVDKPVVKLTKEHAKVYFGAKTGAVKVTLFDSNDDIVYRHSLNGGTNKKSYDLSKLSAGTYKFQFKTGLRTFYHYITLK